MLKKITAASCLHDAPLRGSPLASLQQTMVSSSSLWKNISLFIAARMRVGHRSGLHLVLAGWSQPSRQIALTDIMQLPVALASNFWFITEPADGRMCTC
jgi:hypothetical protein